MAADFVLVKRSPGKTSSVCLIHFNEYDFQYCMDSKTKRSLKADEIRLQEQTSALTLIPSRDLPYPLVLFCNFVAIPRLLMVLPRRVPCSSGFQCYNKLQNC